jgi:SAM-dependent methyltransferase
MAELLVEQDRSVTDLILLDASIQMLAYSFGFMRFGVRGIVGDASLLPFRPAEASLVVASLGDAFNNEMFWTEVARCLSPSGVCIFTTPSYEWAYAFRSSSERERDGFAFFELRDGRAIYVPSMIRPPAEQAGMITRSGLTLIETMTINSDLVPPPHSNKISLGSSIVTGYLAIRK